MTKHHQHHHEVVPLRDRDASEYDGKKTVSLPFPAPDNSFIIEVRLIYRGFLATSQPKHELRENEAEAAALEYIGRIIHAARVADHKQQDNPGWTPPPIDDTCWMKTPYMGRKPEK